MIDETTSQTSTAAPGPGEGSAETVVAFCQQCGRALTASTRRQVGSSIFCEPCATARHAQGWVPVNPAAAAPYAAAPAATTGEPNAVLAGILGLIPGVGAMYNGQYAKGVIHLIVFVVLVSLADNLNWVFWWLVWGWIFYQAFEAYHTAQARRDGLPIPDPFGWNELSERLGFVRNAPPAAPRTPRPTAPPPFTPAPSAFTPVAPPPPVEGVPETAAFQGAPPVTTAFAANPGVPPSASTGPYAPYTQVPYASTYAGPAGTPVMPPSVAASAQRFPAGAIWLIILGVLFLLGNILPAWRITGRWLVPLLLAAIALWIGSRRLATYNESTAAMLAAGLRPSLAGALMGPCIVLTIAILLAMQDAYWIPLRHSWPALLIVWGALLLIQRGQNLASSTQGSLDGSTPLGGPVPPVHDTSSR